MELREFLCLFELSAVVFVDERNRGNLLMPYGPLSVQKTDGDGDGDENFALHFTPGKHFWRT